MDATIYIPTFQRLDRQFTWDNLSEHWRARAYLVAPLNEVEALRKRGHRVIACGAEGIGPTRQWIMDQHDIELLGEHIIMMDDDLNFYRRREDDPGKFLRLTQDWEFDAMMERFLAMFQYAPLVGLANRSGANRITEPYRLNSRLHDLLGINLAVARQEDIRIDRVRFMEDFDLALQFLSKGYFSLCLSDHCKDDRGSNAPGGCSTYRSLEGQAKAARKMAKLWPDFVALTERPGWGGEMDAPRTDVRIAWQKAYRSGVADRELLGTDTELEPSWEPGAIGAHLRPA